MTMDRRGDGVVGRAAAAQNKQGAAQARVGQPCLGLAQRDDDAIFSATTL